MDAMPTEGYRLHIPVARIVDSCPANGSASARPTMNTTARAGRGRGGGRSSPRARLMSASSYFLSPHAQTATREKSSSVIESHRLTMMRPRLEREIHPHTEPIKTTRMDQPTFQVYIHLTAPLTVTAHSASLALLLD